MTATENKLAEALRKQVRDWNTSADIAASNGDNSGSAQLRICAQQAENLLAAHDAQRAESGAEWVMVPREPTEAMRDAHRMYADTSDWWNAVIAAAPEKDHG